MGKQIYFLYEEDKKSKDLNVTNIWDFKEILFEEAKLKEPFILDFLKDLFTKEKIEKIYMEKFSMFSYCFCIIQKVPTITYLKFMEDSVLPSEFLPFLQELKVNEINCYTASSFVLNELEKKNITLSFRKKVFIKSDFMIQNDLTTLPKIKNAKKIILYGNMNRDSLVDLEYFLKENKSLFKIECYGFDVSLLKQILSKLLVYGKKDISIYYYQEKEEKDILKVVDFLDKKLKKELKEARISFYPLYTKKYKETYYLKQVNIHLFRMVLLIFILFLISIYSITQIQRYNSKKEIKKLDNIKEEVTIPEIKEETKVKEEVKKENKKKQEQVIEKVTYQKDFSKLKQINSEFVAWLFIPNTTISYPLVQHSNNTYYLNHSFDKSSNMYGWIYLDYRNHKSFTDQNTIIYGHDTYDTFLFGTLNYVLKPSWYNNKNNLKITLETEKGKKEATIFSIYTTKVTDDYLQVVFSKNEYQTFLDKITKRSIKDFNNKPTVEDKIITLSTCYKDDSHRLVVHAKIK